MQWKILLPKWTGEPNTQHVINGTDRTNTDRNIPVKSSERWVVPSVTLLPIV
jgi:hypothetical protein